MPNDSALFENDHRAVLDSPKSVLCVDADDESRLLVAELLYEYDVDFALTGDDAVQLAHSRTYDLYIVDPSVPGCDGLDLLRDLRLYDRNAPLVVCTVAQTGAHDVSACEGFVQKPYGSRVLRETVLRLMRHHADS